MNPQVHTARSADVRAELRRHSAMSEHDDAEIAAEMECGRCGCIGLNYQARYDRGRNGYVYNAVARCPRCGWSTEF